MSRKPTKAPACPDCGRRPSECWTMPCLGLEIAMRKGYRAMLAWSKAAGIKVQDHEALKAEIQDRRERVGA
jgi:hypothetical protein